MLTMGFFPVATAPEVRLWPTRDQEKTK